MHDGPIFLILERDCEHDGTVRRMGRSCEVRHLGWDAFEDCLLGVDVTRVPHAQDRRAIRLCLKRKDYAARLFGSERSQERGTERVLSTRVQPSTGFCGYLSSYHLMPK